MTHKKHLRYIVTFAGVPALILGMAVPALAQSAGDIAAPFSTAGFLLLLPLGLLLLTLSALPDAERDAPQAAITALVVWGIAVLAYFVAGFAFEFGGVAVSNPHPDFAQLALNWSPLAASFGPNWGFAGLRGWLLLGGAATPAVYDLFLRHIAFLGVATLYPTLALYRRVRVWALIGFGAVSGTLILPLAGNWVWSAGWLANLGLNLQMGHGFVDAGVGVPFLVGGVVTLAGLWATKAMPAPIENPPKKDEPTFVETPMPTAYLPVLSILGLALVLWSWAFAANGAHIPTATDLVIPRAALNGFLGAFAALVFSAGYSRFTTGKFDVLMTARGGVAGLAVTAAGAALMLPWEAALAGAVAGVFFPPLTYFFDRRLGLDDTTAGGAMLGVMGALGLLLVGLVADGTMGTGWNGVSGAIAANFPAQLNAQLIGVGVVALWAAAVTLGIFRAERWLTGRTAEMPPETSEPETEEILDL